MLDVLRDRVGGGRRNLPDLGRLRGYAAVRLGLRFSYSAGEVGSADLIIGGQIAVVGARHRHRRGRHAGLLLGARGEAQPHRGADGHEQPGTGPDASSLIHFEPYLD